jgi:hypothetical protein
VQLEGAEGDSSSSSSGRITFKTCAAKLLRCGGQLQQLVCHGGVLGVVRIGRGGEAKGFLMKGRKGRQRVGNVEVARGREEGEG